MTRDASHIGMIRLVALAVVFLVAGSLTDARAMDHHSPMDPTSNVVHTDDMHVPESDCTGDKCGVCDASGGGDHASGRYAEHCPDCLAQVPAGPETLRVDRRTNADTAEGSNAAATDDITRPLPVHFLSSARSGLTTRSPILRL